MSINKDVDLDSFFNDFNKELTENIEENQKKISEQIQEAKAKASEAAQELPEEPDVLEKDEEVATVKGDSKPIKIELPAVYNSEEKSATQDDHIADHLTQHWGF